MPRRYGDFICHDVTEISYEMTLGSFHDVECNDNIVVVILFLFI